MFGGEELLVLLVLALGGAMLVGNAMAWFRPRADAKPGELERPPAARTAIMVAIGAVATVWALASLLTK